MLVLFYLIRTKDKYLFLFFQIFFTDNNTVAKSDISYESK